MRRARVVIGPTGAALANLIFCMPDTVLLTWMHDAWGSFPVYSTLAKVSGIKIRYLDVYSKNERYHGKYHLNPEYFNNAVEEFINL